MENENKEKVILTDEELKEVAGGSQCLPMGGPAEVCARKLLPRDCMKVKECTWTGAKCITKSKS